MINALVICIKPHHPSPSLGGSGTWDQCTINASVICTHSPTPSQGRSGNTGKCTKFLPLHCPRSAGWVPYFGVWPKIVWITSVASQRCQNLDNIYMFAVLIHWWVEAFQVDRTTSMCIWTTAETRVRLLERKKRFKPLSYFLLNVPWRCFCCGLL